MLVRYVPDPHYASHRVSESKRVKAVPAGKLVNSSTLETFKELSTCSVHSCMSFTATGALCTEVSPISEVKHFSQQPQANYDSIDDPIDTHCMCASTEQKGWASDRGKRWDEFCPRVTRQAVALETFRSIPGGLKKVFLTSFLPSFLLLRLPRYIIPVLRPCYCYLSVPCWSFPAGSIFSLAQTR